MTIYEANYNLGKTIDKSYVYEDELDEEIDILSLITLTDNYVPFIDSAVVKTVDMDGDQCPQKGLCDAGQGDCDGDSGCMSGFLCG